MRASSRKAVNSNFKVVDLTRLGIKPKSTAADTTLLQFVHLSLNKYEGREHFKNRTQAFVFFFFVISSHLIAAKGFCSSEEHASWR